MEQKELREREARCVQENPPGCTAGCPVHVDARGLIKAVREGSYDAAWALFSRMVPFPGIISRVCEQPCRKACRRNELDEAININALERVCADNSSHPAATVARQPAKNAKVAVVGAGLSGLTVAFELAPKGYTVVIFEAKNRLGGSVWEYPESTLPRQVIETDLAVFRTSWFEVHCNTVVGDDDGSDISFSSLCETFDAVYLGIGEQADALELGLRRDAEGRIAVDSQTLATSHPKVFAGGSLCWGKTCRSPINSISYGKIAAISIDRLLQGASLSANRGKEGPYVSTLYTDIRGATPEPMTPLDPLAGYSEEAALREANRCLQCECRECVKVCEFLEHFRAYPKRYVREIYNNLSIVMGIHHANKMINSCSLCGLCEEVCPGKLNMGEICREARRAMVKKGKMPPSAHDFALRDMEFSNSEQCALVRHQPGWSSSKLVFFPGCQLAASRPQYVRKLYEYLCEKVDGGVGLMLGCCGVPADWAGRADLFQQTLQNIKTAWNELGNPSVITACPTCFSIFSQNLADVPVETVWTLLDRIGLPDCPRSATIPEKLAVHDSCTTRHDAALQESIRNIMTKLGYQIEELPRSRGNTTCCSFGGLMLYTNRELARKVTSKRITESDSDYLAYCAMCRDNFAAQGKRVYHILDLIFGVDAAIAGQEGPDCSRRQENRAELKRSMLREVWGEQAETPRQAVKILVSESVRQVMEDRMILDDDVARVIAHAEATGSKFKNARNGHLIAYYKPVSVTYWVEYSPQSDGYLIHNAYCHRLEIIDS